MSSAMSILSACTLHVIAALAQGLQTSVSPFSLARNTGVLRLVNTVKVSKAAQTGCKRD